MDRDPALVVPQAAALTALEVEHVQSIRDLRAAAMAAQRENVRSHGLGWVGLFFGSFLLGGCVLPRFGLSGEHPAFLVAALAGVVGLLGAFHASGVATRRQERLLRELKDVRCAWCDEGIASRAVRAAYGPRPGRQAQLFRRVADTARSVLERGVCPCCKARWFRV